MELRRILGQARTGKGNRPEAYRRGHWSGYQARRRGSDRFLALINSWQLIPSATNRWQYQCVEAIWESLTVPPRLIVKTNGRVVTAYNPIENGNEGLVVESGGVDVAGPAYPPGFNLKPIRGGLTSSWANAEAPACWVQSAESTTGATVWFLDGLMNMHDGTCT